LLSSYHTAHCAVALYLMETTNSPQRYLLVRPLGGLNDVLCQVEFARRKADKSGRTLVVQSETGSPGLRHRFGEPFSNLFRFVDSKHKADFEPLRPVLQHDASIWPKDFEDLKNWFDKSLQEATRDSKIQCRLELKPPKSATVAVHEGFGGGFDSFSALEHLELNPVVVKVAKDIKRSLPTNLSAIHFRNSDYKSNFEDLLAKSLGVREGETILLASDDASIAPKLQRELPNRKILAISSLFQDYPSLSQTERAIQEMLIMSGCSELSLIPVQVAGPEIPVYSGYGRLTEHLWVVRQMQLGRISIFFRHIIDLALQSPRRRRNPLRLLVFLALRAPQIVSHAFRPRGVYKQLSQLA